MQTCTKEQFLAALAPGDIGLIRARNLFATLQNWYRKKFNEGTEQASHGFLMTVPPSIAEANGVFVSSGSTVIKNIGDSTKCWVFRSNALTLAGLEKIEGFINGAVKAGGHYSVGGIMQFAAQFFGIRKKLVDEGGVFCTEFTSDAIIEAELPYITDRPPFQITPSYQLNWLLNEGPKFGWTLVAHYDGAGNYFLADQIAKAA